MENKRKWLNTALATGMLATGLLAADLSLTTQAASAGTAPQIWLHDYTGYLLKPNGQLVGWGYNGQNQLGFAYTNGAWETTPKVIPDDTLIPGMTNFVGGTTNTSALKNGTVYSWGNNDNGILGIGSTANQSTPTQVVTTDNKVLSGITSLSANFSNCFAVDQAGYVWSWGDNSFGGLGIGTKNVPINQPAAGKVPNLSGVKATASGQQFVLALKTDGTVYSWGTNAAGQLGYGQHGSQTETFAPVQVKASPTAPLTGIAQVAAGSNYSLALTNAGTVYAWGGNSYGDLGNGTTTNSDYPVQVLTAPGTPLTEITQIVSNYNAVLALRKDGTVWSWGQYSGDGTQTITKFAKQVQGLTGAVQVAAGRVSLGVLTKRGLYTWGTNTYAQLGVGDQTSRWSPTPVPNLFWLSATATGYDSKKQVDLKMVPFGTPVSQYKITRTPAHWQGTVTTSNELWSDLSVAPGNHYSYKIEAYNAAGALMDSTNVDINVPVWIYRTLTTISPTEIKVEYSANGPVARYEIQRNGVPISLASGDIDSGLMPNTQYTYRFIAYDALGNQIALYHSSATTDALVELQASAEEQGPDAIQLTFSPLTGSVDHYDVYQLPDTTTPKFTSAASPLLDSNLQPETAYSYRIVARNKVGTILASQDVTATTTPRVNVALNLTVTGSDAIDIGYTADGTVASYAVYRDAETTPYYEGQALSVTDAARTSNTAYSYTVVAYDAKHHELGRATQSATTWAHVELDVQATAMAEAVQLDTAVTGDGASVDHFVVTRSDATDLIYTGTALTATDSNLLPDTEYSYTVTAYDAAGHVIGQRVVLVRTLTIE